MTIARRAPVLFGLAGVILLSPALSLAGAMIFATGMNLIVVAPSVALLFLAATTAGVICSLAALLLWRSSRRPLS